MEYKYTLIYKSSYREDIDEIARYYAEQYKDSQLVVKLKDRVKQKAKILKNFPYVYSIYDSNVLMNFRYRWFIVGNYKVFYHVDEIMKIVFIDRIIYSRMDLKNMYI